MAPWSSGSLAGSQSSSELSTSVGSGDMFGDKLGGRQVPDVGSDAGIGGMWRECGKLLSSVMFPHPWQVPVGSVPKAATATRSCGAPVPALVPGIDQV